MAVKKIQTKYAVLINFTDDKDPEKTVYIAGENLYSRDGYKPTETRIAYLQSDKTRFKKPVISKE